MESLITSNLQALRRFHRLTQREFSEALGVSESLVSRIESGDRQPSAGFAETVCEKFHLKPNTLYGVDLTAPPDSETKANEKERTA